MFSEDLMLKALPTEFQILEETVYKKFRLFSTLTLFSFFFVVSSFLSTSNTMKRQREHHDFFNLPIGIIGDERSIEQVKKLCQACEFETVEFIMESEWRKKLKSWVNEIKDKVCHVVLATYETTVFHDLRKFMKCGISTNEDFQLFLGNFMEPLKHKFEKISPFYVDEEDEQVHEILKTWMSKDDCEMSSLIKAFSDANASHVKILMRDFHSNGMNLLYILGRPRKSLRFDVDPDPKKFRVVYENSVYGHKTYKEVQPGFDLKNTTLLFFGFNGDYLILRCDKNIERKLQETFSNQRPHSDIHAFGDPVPMERSLEQQLMGTQEFELVFSVFSVGK